MTKYHESFKQQVIKFYLQNSKRSLTRQHFQLKKTTFDRCFSQYKHHGINGLAIRSKKQVYSLEFKLPVIQAVKNGKYSAEQVVIHAGKADIVKEL